MDYFFSFSLLRHRYLPSEKISQYLSSEVTLEGISGVLECGAGVPVGGEPGGSDSDEDGESEDLHPGNVYAFDYSDNVRSNNLFCVFIPLTTDKTRVSSIVQVMQ